MARRALTPAELAGKLDKWEAAGFPRSQTAGALRALEQDLSEAQGRVPKRSGKLAKTLRIINPSMTRAQKKGVLRFGLAAGSRSKTDPVRYARVLQEGGKTRPHPIPKARPDDTGKRLSMTVGGNRIARARVQHPGSTFRALEYLKVNEDRLAGRIEVEVQQAINAEIG